ncbi:cytosine methyltransferase [Desulfuromonas soudanensis]|uniref:DNA (cytosine-5-)-methyltransferase n=1 Tax=Desulfuromonas soudanensis TaxID=1603606 RepID=A0A0M4DAX0_9BACT|nr:DNA cytosine methyltransferase [Desulfuromonas soudanensis]ALC17392.1 cytosine methyltransferase [Desulfuromonas soudanensis]
MARPIEVNKKVEAIDLFCGIGGLTYGMQKAGIVILAGLDFDKSCKYAYEENNDTEFIDADISTYPSEKLIIKYSKKAIKVLVGCAPCQTFSKHTQKNKDRSLDKKWNLLYSFSDKITEIKPDIISMENVPGLTKYSVFTDFISHLVGLGYHVSHKIVKCEEYGVPQFRRRLVLLASRLGEINLIPETHKAKIKQKTVRDVIGQLPPLDAGTTDPKDRIHRSAFLSNLNLKRIKQSMPDGTWRDWDTSLLPDCYTKASGQSYSSVYGRLNWNRPSVTMTTQFFSYGTGRFGHPSQNRALSLREGAILQTFPRNYKFVNPKEEFSFKIIGRHIGNAVPVRLGEIIGRSILKHIKDVS